MKFRSSRVQEFKSSKKMIETRLQKRLKQTIELPKKRSFTKISANTSLFKKIRSVQADYIDDRMSSYKGTFMTDKTEIKGTVEGIALNLKYVATKLVQTFFKTNATCLVCSVEGSIGNRIERAHANITGGTRPELLVAAIRYYWKSINQGIPISKIMKRFIALHKTVPILSLCQRCHRCYDK